MSNANPLKMIMDILINSFFVHQIKLSVCRYRDIATDNIYLFKLSGHRLLLYNSDCLSLLRCFVSLVCE